MAHFAKVENGIVENVVVVPDEHEHEGNDYLNRLGLDGVWIQASVNTYGGVHRTSGDVVLEGKTTVFGEAIVTGPGLRKNYPEPGYSYDAARDAFIPPKPYESWILDEETCLWNPPPRPTAGSWEWSPKLGEWVDNSKNPASE